MTKKKALIIGGIALALIAALVVALISNSRFKAAVSVAQSATMGEEAVTEKSAENEQIAQEMQELYQIPEITLTPELQAAIADGSMTLEEAAAQLLAGGNASETPDASEPVQETPVTPEPVTETPVTPEPVTETPATPEPVTETPATPEPAPETPVTPEPVTETPATPEPVTETPVTPEPAPETPVTPEPAPETPDTSEAVTPEPVAETSKPVTTEPAKQETPVTPEPVKEETPQPSAEEIAQAKKEARVQNLFAQLYVLRDSFNARLEGVVRECMDEFLALEPEKQTNTAKLRIVYAHMSDVEEMEAECDAQVEEILSQLAEIDSALAEKASQYYKNEKELKKADLVARYTGKAN